MLDFASERRWNTGTVGPYLRVLDYHAAEVERMAEDGVAAVERALSILDSFNENDESLTLSDLAERKKLRLQIVIRPKYCKYILHQINIFIF